MTGSLDLLEVKLKFYLNKTNKISNIDSQDEKITVHVFSITQDDRGIELD